MIVISDTTAITALLRIIGLLGVLLQAKRRKLVPSVRTLTEDMERLAGFRVSEEVKQIIFKSAGE